MLPKIMMAVALFTAPSTVSASSSSAWEALNADVARSCVAASKLRQARAGQVIGFDDTLGKFVTIVTGTSTLARGKKATISMHCVYDVSIRRRPI